MSFVILQYEHHVTASSCQLTSRWGCSCTVFYILEETCSWMNERGQKSKILIDILNKTLKWYDPRDSLTLDVDDFFFQYKNIILNPSGTT